jgi:hypothetical protein
MVIVPLVPIEVELAVLIVLAVLLLVDILIIPLLAKLLVPVPDSVKVYADVEVPKLRVTVDAIVKVPATVVEPDKVFAIELPDKLKF